MAAVEDDPARPDAAPTIVPNPRHPTNATIARRIGSGRFGQAFSPVNGAEGNVAARWMRNPP